MFCHKCGSQLVDDASFCSVCGTKVQTPGGQTESNGFTHPAAPGAPVGAVPSTPPNPQAGSHPTNSSSTNTNTRLLSFGTPSTPSPSAPTSTVQPPITDAGAQYRAYYNQPNANSSDWPYNPAYSNPRANISMGWHKFLIYFSLWVGAIGNIIGGIIYMFGAHYITVNPYSGKLTSYADAMYYMYEGLQIYDIIYGIFLIATGIMLLIARNALANYKENAPKLILAAYINVLVDDLIYLVFYLNIIDDSTVVTSFISIIGTCVIMIINYVYYKKRDFMFYN
ncbi:MAG: zinc-ribbon domain-containing protein [Clostridia bacterium]|nr:zinc-ribbon domain-containing protein [Clostridia bacterium]